MLAAKRLSFLLLGLIVSGCAVKPNVQNEYQLMAYSQERFSRHPTQYSLFIQTPEAASAYQTESMWYITKPYALNPFIHNAWVSPPSEMLLPLMVKSISKSGFFHVVASNLGLESTHYRLDTQILELNQSFLTKPSQVHFVVKVVLLNVAKNRPVASRLFAYQVTCPTDDPYGGVLAANQAVKQFTREVTAFIIKAVKQVNK